MEDGSAEDHLIRPAPAWTDWDPTAEAVHGLSREVLLASGEPHEAVAARMMQILAAHEVFASAPSWDGKWLSVLLRAAGFPRHALRLRDTDAADLEAAVEILASGREAGDVTVMAERIVRETRDSLGRPPDHRALADARQEFEVWQEIQRRALAMADATASPRAKSARVQDESE